MKPGYPQEPEWAFLRPLLTFNKMLRNYVDIISEMVQLAMQIIYIKKNLYSRC